MKEAVEIIEKDINELRKKIKQQKESIKRDKFLLEIKEKDLKAQNQVLGAYIKLRNVAKQ